MLSLPSVTAPAAVSRGPARPPSAGARPPARRRRTAPGAGRRAPGRSSWGDSSRRAGPRRPARLRSRDGLLLLGLLLRRGCRRLRRRSLLGDHLVLDLVVGRRRHDLLLDQLVLARVPAGLDDLLGVR